MTRLHHWLWMICFNDFQVTFVMQSRSSLEKGGHYNFYLAILPTTTRSNEADFGWPVYKESRWQNPQYSDCKTDAVRQAQQMSQLASVMPLPQSGCCQLIAR